MSPPGPRAPTLPVLLADSRLPRLARALPLAPETPLLVRVQTGSPGDSMPLRGSSQLMLVGSWWAGALARLPQDEV